MLSAAVGYVASILGYAATATRTFHRLVLPYFIVTVVAIISAAILIPRDSLTGAAWASGVVNLAACLAPICILARLHFNKHYGTAPRSAS